MDVLKEQYKLLVKNEKSYKVYGIPEKSLKDHRMGSQFEVEPDQKFRLAEEEIGENLDDTENEADKFNAMME